VKRSEVLICNLINKFYEAAYRFTAFEKSQCNPKYWFFFILITFYPARTFYTGLPTPHQILGFEGMRENNNLLT
jgi:hypothetical protein